MVSQRPSQSLVEIRKGHTFVSLEQVGDIYMPLLCISYSLASNKLDSYGIATIKDSASNKTYKVCSKHMVACDGKSTVLNFLGIETELLVKRRL